jgi:hypothetical protein
MERQMSEGLNVYRMVKGLVLWPLLAIDGLPELLRRLAADAGEGL